LVTQQQEGADRKKSVDLFRLKPVENAMKRLLIANRGEIACRIARSAREHGIATIAVYTDVDAGALHLQACDDAVAIGQEAPGQRSPYLDAQALLAAAKRAGADAVHPGYGFLSERADFANAVLAAGLVWVGPPPEVMAALGRKDAAKALARRLGVPVVPGFEVATAVASALQTAARRLSEDEDAAGAQDRARRALDRDWDFATLDPQDLADADKPGGRLAKEETWHEVGASPDDVIELAEAVGYPVLVKAVAGGGGRGMRVVRACGDLLQAVALAAREALEAFGDGTLLIEKFIERGRHIEVQILADAHGKVLHLGERECSIQRRHQKLIEETPAPGVDQALRQRITDAALTLASGVGYVSAGTVEFLLDEASGHFYFLEVNTRIQVEHAVTEFVTGLDLVAWQLAIAQGLPLPMAQEDIIFDGHAIEARLCAEDPRREFAPAAGPVFLWRAPEGEGIRVDHGLHPADTVPVHYDAMVAKVVAWGADRGTAISRLVRALGRTRLLGLVNNRTFLMEILQQRDFVQGRLTTHYLEDHPIRSDGQTVDDATLVAAALWRMGGELRRRFRNNPMRPDVSVFELPQADGQVVHVALVHRGGARFGWGVARQPDPLLWQLPATESEVELVACAQAQITLADARGRVSWDVAAAHGLLALQAHGGEEVLLREATLLPLPGPTAAAVGAIVAPGAAVVTAIHVQVGETVAVDAALVTLEAMKMLTVVRAAQAGVIAEIRVRQGESVAAGAPLVEVTPSTDAV